LEWIKLEQRLNFVWIFKFSRAHSSASSLLSSGVCRCRTPLRCRLTPTLPRRLCRFAARSPHHPSTQVLRTRQVKSSCGRLLTPHSSLPRPLSRAAHATTHACKHASAHSSVGRLLIPSPTCHCVLLLHTHVGAFAFLCHHCHRAHLAVDRPLHHTNHPTDKRNGSRHPPPSLVDWVGRAKWVGRTGRCRATVTGCGPNPA
jgi:hypothetical protein